MIFRREIRVPEPRGCKKLRLVKFALLVFLMTPKVALLAFVMAPIVYFYQKPPLTEPKYRRDATQIIQRQGYQCSSVEEDIQGKIPTDWEDTQGRKPSGACTPQEPVNSTFDDPPTWSAEDR
jgi:hypothetical protein